MNDNRERKIEKINAYRKILETKRLPKLETSENGVPTSGQDVEQEIHSEFTAFVEAQLSTLMGESQPSNNETFSPREITLLKAMAAKLDQKVEQTTKKVEPPRQRPPTPSVKPDLSARPMGNRNTQREAANRVGDVLDQLVRMEDETNF